MHYLATPSYYQRLAVASNFRITLRKPQIWDLSQRESCKVASAALPPPFCHLKGRGGILLGRVLNPWTVEILKCWKAQIASVSLLRHLCRILEE